MQIELTADQVGALAARLSQAGEPAAGLFYDGEALHVPDALIAAAEAIMAETGWEAAGSADALLRYAANKRWEIETGGINLAGVPVATDDRSKIMIMGARVAAQANGDWTTIWHGSDGGTYPLNAAAMIAISDAVEAHLNATFATFAQVKADIEAGEITTTAEIDAAFA